MQYMTTATSFTVNQGELINGSKPVRRGTQKMDGFGSRFSRAAAIQTPLENLQAISPPSLLLGEWELYASLRGQGKTRGYGSISRWVQHILQNPRERMASQGGNVDWFLLLAERRRKIEMRKKKSQVCLVGGGSVMASSTDKHMDSSRRNSSSPWS